MNHLTGINIGISMDFSLVSVSVEHYLSVCASGSLVILGVPLCGFQDSNGTVSNIFDPYVRDLPLKI